MFKWMCIILRESYPCTLLKLQIIKITAFYIFCFIIQRRYLEQFNLLIFFLISEGNVPEFLASGNSGFDSSLNHGPTSMFNEERVWFFLLSSFLLAEGRINLSRCVVLLPSPSQCLVICVDESFCSNLHNLENRASYFHRWNSRLLLFRDDMIWCTIHHVRWII